MRLAFLAAASIAALGTALPAYAQKAEPARAQTIAANEERAPAAQLLLTSPPNADINRTYEGPEEALEQADIDYLIREARRSIANGDQNAMWTVLAFTDDLAANRLADARRVLTGAPGGINGGLSDMLEPFLLAAEGNADRGVERIDAGGDALPRPLPEVARALVFEGAGRLEEAAAIYALMVEQIDTTPPGDEEPRTMEEFERSLRGPRTAHAVYRAALVHHRLGRTEEARRYYEIVRGFTPRAAEVAANLRRLEAGQAPIEAALDTKTAAARWMFFLSEYLTQAETLATMIATNEPIQGIASESGTALLQLGVLLSPDAGEWRLYAAQQLIEVNALDGAQRIIDLMPADSTFAPDADIVRASIALERNDRAAAGAAAERALAQAGDRWSIIAAAADIYRQSGDSTRAIAGYDRVLTMVTDNEERADVLGYRAYAHRYAGNLAAATADMRAALEIDQSLDTRLLYISILMDDPRGWADGIRVARGVFAEQPESSMRLNALGYALIQRPEGLEEGYRLLWRGFNANQSDYAVIDSLGWAYYLHGHFDQARALIERSRDLTADNPNAEVLDHLGDIYWRLNRRDDARTTWRQAIEAHPDAIRRRDLEQKVSRGLTTPAPRERELPRVDLPTRPSQREEL